MELDDVPPLRAATLSVASHHPFIDSRNRLRCSRSSRVQCLEQPDLNQLSNKVSGWARLRASRSFDVMLGSRPGRILDEPRKTMRR